MYTHCWENHGSYSLLSMMNLRSLVVNFSLKFIDKFSSVGSANEPWIGHAFRFWSWTECHPSNISEQSIPSESDVDSPFVVVENARFQPAPNSKTTPREFLACALDIRKFQKHTRLHRCDIGDLRREIENSDYLPGISKPTGTPAENDKIVRKAKLEKTLRQLLQFLTPDTFQVICR